MDVNSTGRQGRALFQGSSGLFGSGLLHPTRLLHPMEGPVDGARPDLDAGFHQVLHDRVPVERAFRQGQEDVECRRRKRCFLWGLCHFTRLALYQMT